MKLRLLLFLLLFSIPALCADVQLAWDSVATATGYKIYVGSASGTYTLTYNVGNVTTYTVTGLGPGTWYFAATAYDATRESGYSNEVSTTIVAPPVVYPPVITSSLTKAGTGGVSLSYQIAATNSPAMYASSTLPTGLSLNTSTGTITGVPTYSGIYNITISATNSAGTGSATLVMTIRGAPPTSLHLVP
jgi:hypothetical protein